MLHCFESAISNFHLITGLQGRGGGIYVVFTCNICLYSEVNGFSTQGKSFDAFKRGGTHHFRIASIVNVGFSTKQYCSRVNIFAFCSSKKYLKSIYCKQI